MLSQLKQNKTEEIKQNAKESLKRFKKLPLLKNGQNKMK